MKKSELVQLFAAAKTTINHLRDNLYLLRDLNALRQLESEERLLQKVLSFQLTPGFSEKDNEDEVEFSEFIQSTNFTDLALEFEEEGQLARICHLWLKDQTNDECTFMGTDIAKIPLKNLVYLDGSYFDITEILPFMVSQQADGKKIFQNPASTARASFSSESISILVNHSVTNEFLTSHASEEACLDIQRSQLPDRFFDLLHEYLLALCEIGKNSTPAGNWGFFTEASVQQCDDARQAFFNKIDQEISIEHRLVLSKIKIYAPLKVGGTEDVAYSKVIEGGAGYDCVISQQIYLWAFLRERRPETIVPNEVASHWQASRYDLGNTNTVQNTSLTNDLPIDLVQFVSPDFSQFLQPNFSNNSNEFAEAFRRQLEVGQEERTEFILNVIREATNNLPTPRRRESSDFPWTTERQIFRTPTPQHDNVSLSSFNTLFPSFRDRDGASPLFPRSGTVATRAAAIENSIREQRERAQLANIQEVTRSLRLRVESSLISEDIMPALMILENNLGLNRRGMEELFQIPRTETERVPLLALTNLGFNRDNQNRRSNRNDQADENLRARFW